MTSPSNPPFLPPLVSIIITNYNYGRFLRDAANSVFAQTYPHVECIIVDDASTDESSIVLAKIAADYPAAKVIRRPVNGGQTAATLDGFAASTGDYVVFLDADDLLFDEYVATHVFVNLSLRLPPGFTCSDMAQVVGDRLVLGCSSAMFYHIRSTTTMKAAVRPIPAEIAGSWCAGMDQLILDQLYSVDMNCKSWPWSATSGFFYRRDALKIWADTPGLAEMRDSTDAFFAIGINSLTGSVLIDRSLGAYRTHGKNVFSKNAQLTNVRQYKEDSAHASDCRILLIDRAARDAAQFHKMFFCPELFETLLDTLDTPDTTPDAPAWATPSRLSYLFVKEYAPLAKLLGESALNRWMIKKGVPAKVMRDAGIRVRLLDQIVGIAERLRSRKWLA